MKALVIAPQPFFSPRGTPFSVYYRTMVMAELGTQIDLLTYGQGQDVDLPGVRIVRIPAFRFLGPVKVGPSYKKLFLDLFVILWTIGLLIRHRYDVVHAHEESVFFSRFLKPIFGFKLIYDMHSSLPEQLGNYRFTRSRLIVGTFEWLESTCLRAADAVITICPHLADYALPRMPDRSRHFLIENSIFDEVRLKQPADAGAASATGATALLPLPAGRPIVGYAGTFEAYQGLDLLIAAFAKARETVPDAFLLMVGGSPPQVEAMRRLAERHGLTGHCLFTGQVPQALAKAYMAQAAVLTSPRSTGSNTPLKIYEQLASGVPLVATRIPSHTQVVDDEVCFLADLDPESMAAALVAALSDREARDRVVANAARLYAEHYSRAAYEGKMRALLNAVA